MVHADGGIGAGLDGRRRGLERRRRALAVAWVMMLPACRPSATVSRPADRTAPPASFDPGAISDAPFTDQECAALGSMRAEDPAEARPATAYTQECIETTKTDPPWMRRTARCVLQAPDAVDRKRCFDQRVVQEREALAERLEAQIEAQAERDRAERLRRAEEVLRQVRQQQEAQPDEERGVER